MSSEPINKTTSEEGDEVDVRSVPVKRRAEFFAAVRARGLLNAMLDGPAKVFEQQNPGLRARWEYSPPSGDNTFVVAREALGFRLVDASELGEATESQQKSGPVRRGDLILMAAPGEIVNQLEIEDARRAYEDFKLPENSYRQHVASIAVQRKDGVVERGTPIGEIRQTTEVVSPRVGSQ